MENISTGLKWVIGVIVTILIIAAAVSIYLVINGYFVRAQEQTLAQSQLITQAEFSVFDNKDVSGQDVLNASTRYSGRPQFSVKISTGENEKGFYAQNNYNICYEDPSTDVNNSGKTPVVNVKDSEKSCNSKEVVNVSAMQDLTKSVNYVNSTAVFKSNIYKDLNGEVRMIVFSQKGAK